MDTIQLSDLENQGLHYHSLLSFPPHPRRFATAFLFDLRRELSPFLLFCCDRLDRGRVQARTTMLWCRWLGPKDAGHNRRSIVYCSVHVEIHHVYTLHYLGFGFFCAIRALYDPTHRPWAYSHWNTILSGRLTTATTYPQTSTKRTGRPQSVYCPGEERESVPIG